MPLATGEIEAKPAENVAGTTPHLSAFEAHFRRLYFGYRMLPFYKNAPSRATYEPAEAFVVRKRKMTISGTDYFAHLMTKVEALAGRHSQNKKPFGADFRHIAPSPALMNLADALMRIPPESRQRVAYNSAMDHAAFLNIGASIDELERDHIEEYCLNYSRRDDADAFLESLTADIDGCVDDAELDANNEASGHSLEQAATVKAKANEIARGIACKKAEDGAREAAEEAYRLAYQWAYEDIFDEAYNQALSQLSEPERLPPGTVATGG